MSHKPLTGYEAQKDRSRNRQLELSESGRDIGKMPEVINVDRKERARSDFKYFCEEYHASTFNLGWSPDHLKVIDRIQRCVLEGGLFAMAMPRGSGKSTLSEIAAEWAVLYGQRDYVCLIGSDEGHAKGMLESIKSEIENNEELLADFPEVCFPVQALEGINQRAKGQLYEGELTRIRWKEDQIVLPSIENSPASAGIIEVAGITGRIRGMKFKRPDGRQVRPSLVIIDDPQTDESARSPSQCRTRERVLSGAILGLAGPGQKIAGVMPCTVITPGDMADSILDRTKHPYWQGERTKLIYKFPTNTKLWDEYAEILNASLETYGDIRNATEFYSENREAMDVGAVVAWEERFEDGELSAVQNAMNLKIKDEIAFWAEYQNEPLSEFEEDEDMLTADEVAGKLNKIKRGMIPGSCSHLTAFIDVQGKALYYGLVAWEDNFTGYVVDYGVYPKQSEKYFTLRQIRKSLKVVHKNTGLEGAIYAGLETLTEQIIDQDWKNENGESVPVDRCLIDSGWGESTDVVFQFCKRSKYKAIVMPSRGVGIGASEKPMNEYKKKKGDRLGFNWFIAGSRGSRGLRHIAYDTNAWKSFVMARLGVAIGDPGCLSIFGTKPKVHQMFADQMTAERSVETEGRGRKVNVWKLIAGRDNHFFDVIVGCAVGASLNGVRLPTMQTFGKKPQKKKIKLSEIKRKRAS